MFIIIAWHPATGKTTLAKKMQVENEALTIFHTDDYMEFGYKDSLYKLIDDIVELGTKDLIVEWIMWARLMRKLQEKKMQSLVSIYVYFTADPDFIRDVYQKERPDKDLSVVISSCKWLDTVDASIDKTLNNDTIFLNIPITEFIKDIPNELLCTK